MKRNLLILSAFLPSLVFAEPQGILNLEGYADAHGVGIVAKRARGDFGEKSVVIADTRLWFVEGYGWTGSAFSTGSRGRIAIHSNQTWTSSANGTYIGFSTTPNGSTTQSENVRVGNDGFSYVRVVNDLDITVSTPTLVGQLGVTSAGVLYISTSAATLGSWVKVGAQ